MVSPDHDRCLDATRADELVDREPRLGTVSQPEPADTRRKALELNSLGSHLEPALQQLILREQVLERLVDHGDVARLAGERCPAEGADPARKQRPDIGRDESRVCEGSFRRLECLPSEMCHNRKHSYPSDELEQPLDVPRDRARAGAGTRPGRAREGLRPSTAGRPARTPSGDREQRSDRCQVEGLSSAASSGTISAALPAAPRTARTSPPACRTSARASSRESVSR